MTAENSGELTAHITSGAVIVYVIEWLKANPRFSWLRAEQKTLQRVVSAVLAAVAAVGINWTYDATHGTLVITGLTSTAILLTGWEWLKQFVVQQLIFDGVVAKEGTNGRRDEVPRRAVLDPADLGKG